ncbi:MAG: hypothetical protein ONB42_12255 [candidate division KSB1 bacterium]|nr:hypothetical protein [candidate division KSB1 bacterium]MDZ7313414.1 hypothetical protein [candidate division KSB1 bacterium]
MTEAKPWYSYITGTYRGEFLSCLQELSQLQDKTTPTFLLIGGAALLLQGMAKKLQWWDIDLIFRNKTALFDFLRLEKHPQLRVQFLEEGISQRTGLHFVHTTWCFNSRWTNVDCIIREGYFDFYLGTAQLRGPFSQLIDVDGQTYRLHLLIAHPWDVIIDKLTLERFEVSLEMLSMLNKDLPHIWEVLERSGDDPAFYTHLIKQTERLGKTQFLRENLFTLLQCAKELGYHTEELSEKVLQFAKQII